MKKLKGFLKKDDEGSATIWLLLASMVAFFSMGLVVDGAGLMQARTQARLAAEAGVVSALSQVDPSSVSLSPAAISAGVVTIQNYGGSNAKIGMISSGLVQGEATMVYSPKFLFFMGEVSVNGTARASLRDGK